MQRIPLQQTPWLILYDGICGWCTGWVRFVIRRDSAKNFQFTSLQSPLGQQLLATYHLPQEHFSTFALETPDGRWLKSTTTLKILNYLEGFLRIFCIFRMIPLSLRDRIYNVIARHYYRLRGKLTACYLPQKEYQNRIL
jgi:predicted DCC family thiol-disulfide oxidoreductase YuxK